MKVQESINKHRSVESPKPKLTSKAPVSTEKQIVKTPIPVLITAPQCPETLSVKVVENDQYQTAIVSANASIIQQEDITTVVISGNCTAQQEISPLPIVGAMEKLVPVPKGDAISIKPTLNDRKDAKTVVRDGKIAIIVAQDAGTIGSTTKEGTPVTVIDRKAKADRTQIVVPDTVNEVLLELVRPESAPPQQPVSVFVGKAPEPSENTVTEAPAPPQEVKVEQARITESPLSAIQPIRKIEKSRPKLAQLAEDKIQNNHLKLQQATSSRTYPSRQGTCPS